MLVILFALIYIVLVARMYQIQIKEGDSLFKIREKQIIKRAVQNPKRGMILDRDALLLADTKPSLSIFMQPVKIPKKELEIVLDKLNTLTGINKEEIRNKLATNRALVWVKRKTDLALKNCLDKDPIPGIGYVLEDKRFYPRNELASHILGFVGVDNKGLAGIELVMEKSLMGKDGFIRYYKDGHEGIIPGKIIENIPAENGENLYLTISVGIQEAAEAELRRYAVNGKIAEGLIIIMNGRSGEILGLASYPTFNPNSYAGFSPFVYNINPAIHTEIPANPILSLILLPALLEMAGSQYINRLGTGKELLSSGNLNNKLISDSARKMDRRYLSRYFGLFGVGETTGIQLPGERAGQINMEEYLAPGKGVWMTPMQIVKAVAILTNGGTQIRPTLLRSSKRGNRNEQNTKNDLKRVILSGTCTFIKEYLARATAGNSILDLKIEGYRCGGIAFPIFSRDEATRDGMLFSGYLDGGSLSEEIVLLSMVRMKDDLSGQGLSINREIWRSIVYELLRYLENQ